MKNFLRATAAVAMTGALAAPAIAATTTTTTVHHPAVVHHPVVRRVVRHTVVRRRPIVRVVHAPPPPPPPPPPTYIHFHGGSVGFIIGVGGASGVVKWHGERYPIDVSGLKVGTIGISSWDVDGEVFHLHRLRDIEGTYSAAEASATAGAGGGGLDMTNDKGVEIHAASTSAGLQLTLSGGGVTIRLKR
jgi:hypothetical protein